MERLSYRGLVRFEHKSLVILVHSLVRSSQRELVKFQHKSLVMLVHSLARSNQRGLVMEIYCSLEKVVTKILHVQILSNKCLMLSLLGSVFLVL